MGEKYIVLDDIHCSDIQAILNDYDKKGYRLIHINSYIEPAWRKPRYNIVLERGFLIDGK